MSNIYIKFKDGETKVFKHEGRAGGSYTKRLTLENGFAIIEDEWGTKTIFPSANIEEIKDEPHAGSRSF